MTIGEGVNILHQKNEFVVEIDGINEVLGFSKAGPFKLNMEEAKYRPGGAKVPYKDLSHGEFENVSFERAASGDDSVNAWAIQCLNALTNGAIDDYKRDGTVKQLGRDGRVVAQYNFYDAYIVEYEPADFDGDANEFTMEKFVLSVYRWERVPLSQ